MRLDMQTINETNYKNNNATEKLIENKNTKEINCI